MRRSENARSSTLISTSALDADRHDSDEAATAADYDNDDDNDDDDGDDEDKLLDDNEE